MSAIERAVDLVLAEPLARLAAGGDAVGFVGADVPIAVLLATGRPFGHLPWSPRGDTPWADEWLESSFPFWARSILEQWHAGAYEGLRTVVFSRAEDASQRLYYYVRELQRRGRLAGPTPAMFDVAHVRRKASLEHTAAAILDLAAELGVTGAALETGLERAETLANVLRDWQAGRAADGPFHERLARAALWSDPTRWIEAAPGGENETGRARVLLAGSVPPDDRLHRAVEAAGACVVAEAHVHALDRLTVFAGRTGDTPERRLAEHVVSTSVAPRAFFDRAAWIVERANAAHAAAVVLWLTREDEALAWHVPAQRRALAAARLAHLVLPAARWQCDDGVLERVDEFCRGIADATA